MASSSHFDISRLREAMLKLLEDDADAYPKLVEQQFPHVLQRIVLLWGKAELGKYVQSLLLAPHPGCKGFPEEVLVEILSLKAVCHVRGLLTSAAKSGSPGLQHSGAARAARQHESDRREEAAAVFERFQRR